MVVIKESHTPPLTWLLGRVINVMAGADGVVRVAKVLTQKGTLVRPVSFVYYLSYMLIILVSLNLCVV